jgi:hypothetical protein
MDPFIESCGLWEDFHDTLVTEVKRALAAVVPDRYTVRCGERSYIVLAASDEGAEDQFQARPDVALVLPCGASAPAGEHADGARTAAVATSESPVSMRALISSEHRESFVEIRDLSPERRLVTTVEILSPSNKRPENLGWKQYLRKRQAHLAGQANLVEIDLLRGGSRMPMEDDWPPGAYYLLVSRKQDSPRCTVWPAGYRRPLPEIPTPLEPPDADVVLSLQPLVESIYVESRYSRDIDYTAPCRPPLSEEDCRWLDQRLRDLGRK